MYNLENMEVLDMPLKEFDPNPTAVINPSDLTDYDSNFPKTLVSCFSSATFERMVNNYNGEQIYKDNDASREYWFYKINYQGTELALVKAPVGAPSCVSVMETAIAKGVQRIIIFGTCGVLDKSIEDCSIIIPNEALRDEGTSYHYAPASRTITVNKDTINTFTTLLDDLNVNYTVGKVWTTDGVYRETRDKVTKRQQEGCICVDMECSAMAALTQFRNVELLHFFYAADNLDNETWDKRSLSNDAKLDEKDIISDIAIKVAYQLSEKY